MAPRVAAPPMIPSIEDALAKLAREARRQTRVIENPRQPKRNVDSLQSIVFSDAGPVVVTTVPGVWFPPTDISVQSVFAHVEGGGPVDVEVSANGAVISSVSPGTLFVPAEASLTANAGRLSVAVVDAGDGTAMGLTIRVDFVAA